MVIDSLNGVQRGMRTNIVLTLTGPDRVGIVEEVTKIILDLGGNIETSRMARLGGEFAVLLLATVPEDRASGLEKATAGLTAKGYSITISRTKSGPPHGWLPYLIEVVGADHEGIIHQVAYELSRRGVNIESMITETTQAPETGIVLFSMTAHLAVPPDLAKTKWESEVTESGRLLNVDIKIYHTHP